MHAQLDALVASFDRMQDRLHRLVARLDDAQFGRRVSPDRWSVAECVAHLNLTGERFLPLIRQALDANAALRNVGPKHSYKQDLAGRMIAFLAGPLPRLGPLRFGRVKTPPPFVPTGELPKATVMATFDRVQAQQAALVHESDGRPIDQIMIASPFAEKIKYSLYSTFIILPAHQERHIEQAEALWPR
ncbi:MAG: DinB family protein [Gemmatimonadaceae bacterium]|nr:DinB family protein [Gemmatimonadaceae bacterium]